MSTAKDYDVTVTFKYPSAGDKDGAPLEIVARDSAEAIQKARAEMSHRGYTRHDGPITYRAKLAKARAS